MAEHHPRLFDDGQGEGRNVGARRREGRHPWLCRRCHRVLRRQEEPRGRPHRAEGGLPFPRPREGPQPHTCVASMGLREQDPRVALDHRLSREYRTRGSRSLRRDMRRIPVTTRLQQPRVGRTAHLDCAVSMGDSGRLHPMKQRALLWTGITCHGLPEDLELEHHIREWLEPHRLVPPPCTHQPVSRAIES